MIEIFLMIMPTMGVDFTQKALDFEGVPTSLVIWDIAGQKQFQTLRTRYYEGASGLILVYSIIDRPSFENASKWLIEAHRFMRKIPPVVVAANKIDLTPEHPSKDIVSTIEEKRFAETFSKKLNTPIFVIETSALRRINIDKIFYELVSMMVGAID